MIAIIDYGAGNTASVANAVMELSSEVMVTSDISRLEEAEKIILPGVGEASAAMLNLEKSGTISFLKTTKKSVLGICLGMQLFGQSSEEGGVTCLEIISYQTMRFRGEDIRIPHMGWSRITPEDRSQLLNGINPGEYFYFAHSFYVAKGIYTSAACEHGGQFSAAVQRGNYYGVQFHPEKSGEAGLKILRNFIELC